MPDGHRPGKKPPAVMVIYPPAPPVCLAPRGNSSPYSPPACPGSRCTGGVRSSMRRHPGCGPNAPGRCRPTASHPDRPSTTTGDSGVAKDDGNGSAHDGGSTPRWDATFTPVCGQPRLPKPENHRRRRTAPPQTTSTGKRLGARRLPHGESGPAHGAQGSRTASISVSFRRASTSAAGPATLVAHRS